MQIVLDDTFIQSLTLPDIRDVVTDSGKCLTIINPHNKDEAIICKTSDLENDYRRNATIMRCLKILLTTASPESSRDLTRLLGMIAYAKQEEAVRAA